MASISDRVGDVGGYLREQREHARLSLRQLATLAGVSNPYLSQVERGLRKPSAEVLQQIARGLRISAEALYVRAGILEEDQRHDIEAAVHAEAALSDRQKRVLLDIYAAFTAENARNAAGPEPAPAPRRRATKKSPAGTRTTKSRAARVPAAAEPATDPAEAGGETGNHAGGVRRRTPRATAATGARRGRRASGNGEPTTGEPATKNDTSADTTNTTTASRASTPDER